MSVQDLTPGGETRRRGVRVAVVALVAWLGLGLGGRGALGDPAAASAGMVAAAHPLASQAGAQMLEQGGNAVDAAVAAAFALAVVEPHASGLGGGGFALVHLGAAELARAKTQPEAFTDLGGGKQVFVDFRETAPASASADMFMADGRRDPAKSLVGGLAVGVPGQVAGLWYLHVRYGRLAWAELIAPAVRLAREGFAVYPTLRGRIAAQRTLIGSSAPATSTFLPAGELPRIGTLIRQPKLGATLERVAGEGPRAFYQGAVGAAIVGAVQAAGGGMTRADLAAYAPLERAPVRLSYRAVEIASAPPPSSGGVALAQILGVLASRPATPANEPRSVEETHRFIEAMRLAFADRAVWLGDPAFFAVPVAGLTDPAYIARRAALVSPDRALPAAELTHGEPAGAPVLKGGSRASAEALKGPGPGYRPTAGPLRDGERTGGPAGGRDKAGGPVREGDQTTHISAIDRFGNAVALTTSINYPFGSGVMPDPGGFFLNNTMDDFAAAPGVPNAYGLIGGEANAIAPGKRPLSSMTPTLIYRDGRLWGAVGSPGGSTIITSVAQFIANVVDRGYDIRRAADAPRTHHQWVPDRLFAEHGSLGAADAAELIERGHVIEFRDGPGDVQAVSYDADLDAYLGASDHRRAGWPAGPNLRGQVLH